MARMKICFVGTLSSTFIKRDHVILKKHFDVDVIEPPKKKTGWITYVFILAKKVKQSNLTFCWFAGWHSAFAIFFSRLFRKKSIVVVGGYDCACVPEIDYGAFSNGRFLKEGLPAKYVFKNTDKVLVVDPSLKSDIIRNAKVKGENIEYLPTGYDPNYWKPEGEKEDIVLTVASANDLRKVKIKGLETFVKSAEYLLERFIVIGVEGKAREYLERISPKNVEIIGFLSEKKLLPYYQKSKVYCQLSIREGLPNTLCEAMLCECVPVGTMVNGIKTAIGDSGFYVAYGDEKATEEAIKKALNVDTGLRKRARNRIEKEFSMKMREKELSELMRMLVTEEKHV